MKIIQWFRDGKENTSVKRRVRQDFMTRAKLPLLTWKTVKSLSHAHLQGR
ncbi:rCG24984, partial [Rattus norvegicus]